MKQINRIRYEKKTRFVVLLTAVTMVVEIFFGIRTNSMALLADGIHMGSHVLAIGLSWFAYVYARKAALNEKFSGNTEKILSLSGYTSGFLLLGFAIIIIFEAIQRFFSPAQIRFREAILVASIGLIVNIISAAILHHREHEGDHNIRAAYLHVVADALISISALAGLTAALIWKFGWLDTLAGIIGSVFILRWAYGLIIDSGKELLDIRKGKD